jgi:hypothetical protein
MRDWQMERPNWRKKLRKGKRKRNKREYRKSET